MSTDTPATDDSTHTRPTETPWQVDYGAVDPIRIRDPVAEALCVLDPGDPFVVDYADVVTVAGHSCPTAAGAYRITQVGLDAIYDADEYPVRGDVEVLAGGPRDDSTYGVMATIVSTITGAAQEDGFAGLGGGYGDRRDHLHYGDLDAVDPTFRFHREDTGDTVEVRYHVGDVPAAGPATGHLPAILEGEVGDDEREAFAAAWHARVEAVLVDDSLFAVAPADWPLD